MKLWLFEDRDPANIIYGRYATLAIVAESEKAAWKIAGRSVEDIPQDVQDFTVREIVLTSEAAGVLVSEFIGS